MSSNNPNATSSKLKQQQQQLKPKSKTNIVQISGSSSNVHPELNPESATLIKSNSKSKLKVIKFLKMNSNSKNKLHNTTKSRGARSSGDKPTAQKTTSAEGVKSRGNTRGQQQPPVSPDKNRQVTRSNSTENASKNNSSSANSKNLSPSKFKRGSTDKLNRKSVISPSISARKIDRSRTMSKSPKIDEASFRTMSKMREIMNKQKLMKVTDNSADRLKMFALENKDEKDKEALSEQKSVTSNIDTITELKSSIAPEHSNLQGLFGYELLEEIGSGGFSKVYRVRCKHTPGEFYACKVFNLKEVDESWNQKCLKKEMQIMLKMVHPNIIHAIDSFKTRSNAYIVMKIAPNGNVSSYMAKRVIPLTEEQSKTWFCDIHSALLYLHRKRIAHRDIKLENFLIDSNYNAMLSDFSFSVQVDELKNEMNNFDKYCKTICGTPCYMAPEIHGLKNGQTYDPFAVDIFAMGVCLFEMVNNEVPFEGEYGSPEILKAIQDKHITFKEQASKECKELVLLMVDPAPTERPNALKVSNHPWVVPKLKYY